MTNIEFSVGVKAPRVVTNPSGQTDDVFFSSGFVYWKSEIGGVQYGDFKEVGHGESVKRCLSEIAVDGLLFITNKINGK